MTEYDTPSDIPQFLHRLDSKTPAWPAPTKRTVYTGLCNILSNI